MTTTTQNNAQVNTPPLLPLAEQKNWLPEVLPEPDQELILADIRADLLGIIVSQIMVLASIITVLSVSFMCCVWVVSRVFGFYF